MDVQIVIRGQEDAALQLQQGRFRHASDLAGIRGELHALRIVARQPRRPGRAAALPPGPEAACVWSYRQGRGARRRRQGQRPWRRWPTEGRRRRRRRRRGPRHVELGPARRRKLASCGLRQRQRLRRARRWDGGLLRRGGRLRRLRRRLRRWLLGRSISGHGRGLCADGPSIIARCRRRRLGSAVLPQLWRQDPAPVPVLPSLWRSPRVRLHGNAAGIVVIVGAAGFVAGTPSVARFSSKCARQRA
mmetsp:Transcript_75306/g.211152  ORF Transcript_75306/g.211152 Transcript_75306/m.211152 type:complete len:246 (-) Transcript_75306:106-843(-)